MHLVRDTEQNTEDVLLACMYLLEEFTNYHQKTCDMRKASSYSISAHRRLPYRSLSDTTHASEFLQSIIPGQVTPR